MSDEICVTWVAVRKPLCDECKTPSSSIVMRVGDYDVYNLCYACVPQYKKRRAAESLQFLEEAQSPKLDDIVKELLMEEFTRLDYAVQNYRRDA